MTSSEAPAPSNSAVPINDQAPWKVLFACILVMLATTFTPPLTRMFGSSAWSALGITEVQWAVALAFRGLILIFFVLFAGAVGDLFGQRRVMLLALGGYLACSLLGVVAPTPTIFVIANILLAVLGAIVRILNVTLLLLAFGQRKRALALMVYSAVYLLGFLLSPLFAEQIGLSAGARWAYSLSIGLGIVALAFAIKVIPTVSTVRAKTINVLILNIWAGGLCAVIFAVILAGIVGWSSILVLTTLGIGGIFLIGLKRFEGNSWGGESWKYQLGFERQLGTAIVSGVIMNLALVSVTTQIFNFLERIQKYDSILAGFGLSPLVVGPILFGAIAIQLNVRFGIRNTLSIGLLVIAVAAAGFSLLQPEIPYWILALLLIVVGTGFIISNIPRLLLLHASVPYGLVATAQAIGGATAQLGGALAYMFMLRLIQVFGLRAFSSLQQDFGLSPAVIAQQLENLTAAAGNFSLLLAPEVELKIAETLAPGINIAYTQGLSQSMLVLAGVCVVAAVLVQIGLAPSSKQTERY